MEIGHRLKIHRENAGYSQQAAADEIGISRQSLSKWENDKVVPDADNLLGLSQLYKVTIDELLKENEEYEKKISENNKEIKSKRRKIRLIETIQGASQVIDEGVILLIMAAFSCLLFPIGYAMIPLIWIRNKKTNSCYRLVQILCIFSLLINIYNTYVYVIHLFDMGTVNVERID